MSPQVWTFLFLHMLNQLKYVIIKKNDEGDLMNQKFEYYIQKILNKVLLQLILCILLSSIHIILSIIFRFRIGSYFVPVIYIIILILLLTGVVINYLLYRKNIWLLKHYEEEKQRVIQRINKYKSDESNGIKSYLFNLFNKNSFKHYDEAIKSLKEEKS